MLDFWELIGRIAAEDTFRSAMVGFKNTPPTKPSSSSDACNGCIVVFLPSDYDRLRAVVAATHPEIPVSMAALGEWMLINTLNPLTTILGDIAKPVKAAIGRAPSADRQFYQALGVSIIDPTFALTFDGAGNKFGFNLNAADLQTIRGLNADTAGFRAASEVFHQLYWSIDCKSWMFAQPSSPANHVHFLDPGGERPAPPQPLETVGASSNGR